MPFPSRQAQTRIKHDILTQYAGAWGGIISQGFASHSPAGTLDLVYFDAFAGYGRYDGDADRPGATDTIWGSPILALRALAAAANRARRGVAVTITGILVEDDSQTYDELLQNLHAAQLGRRIVECDHLRHVDNGAITVVHGDVRQHVEDLLGTLAERAFLLAFVDPFGTAMPMRLLQKLVARRCTDVISLFPVYRVYEHAGSARKPTDARTKQDCDNIKRNTDHMGSERWLSIAAQDLSCPEAAELYAGLYREHLESIDDVVVKEIALSFAGRAVEFGSPGYDLFLTTRNADGAFRINEILRGAEYRKYWDHWRDHENRERVRHENQGEIELFPSVPYFAAPTVAEVEVAIDEVKASVLERLAPGRYTVRQVLAIMADSIYTRTELNRALRMLRNEGKVSYTNLKSGRAIIIVLPTQ